MSEETPVTQPSLDLDAPVATPKSDKPDGVHGVDSEEIMKMAFGEGEENRVKAAKLMRKLDEKLGLLPLMNFKDYDDRSIIETIIHIMRWEPEMAFDCELRKLHEYEMALTAHILYVKARENHWRTMVSIADRDFTRAKKLAASVEGGKTVAEREAMAMSKYPQMKVLERKLDVYKLYSSKCDGLTDTFTQMDNSLKKTLETRRTELGRPNTTRE